MEVSKDLVHAAIMENEKVTNPKLAVMNNTIPVLSKLQVSENNEMEDKRLKATVVENVDVLNTEQTSSSLTSSGLPVMEVGKVLVNPENVRDLLTPLLTDVHGKLKRIRNTRNVAMMLGFYSSATEEITQKRCGM